jgi:conjugal transfer pilus assembly protein TraF
MKLYILMFPLFFWLSASLWAAENKAFFDDHARGWYWYEKHPIDEDDQEEAQDPVAKMSAVRASVQRALDQAILNPTQKNVEQYKVLQDAVAARSALFSKVWQDTLLQHPELDYSIKHPITQIGRQVEVDTMNRQEAEAIQQLAKTSGLFFFYKSRCPYCRAFAPILKRFAENHGITLIAVTVDGIALPEFPDSVIDQGQAQLFGVKVSPALFTVNPYTHKAVPVGFGLMSEDDLQKRILAIAKEASASVGGSYENR